MELNQEKAYFVIGLCRMYKDNSKQVTECIRTLNSNNPIFKYSMNGTRPFFVNKTILQVIEIPYVEGIKTKSKEIYEKIKLALEDAKKISSALEEAHNLPSELLDDSLTFQEETNNVIDTKELLAKKKNLEEKIYIVDKCYLEKIGPMKEYVTGARNKIKATDILTAAEFPKNTVTLDDYLKSIESK